MKDFPVALLQLLPERSADAAETQRLQLQKGIAACRRAKEQGAELALFPEMWSNGYRVHGDVNALRAEAIPADGEFVSAFASLAKELEMAIGVTFLEQYDPLPRNTLRLFDRFGREVLTYAKAHTCDFDVERNLTPGDGFRTAVLDTAGGPIRVGAMICYDREFPESARVLMLQGAELLLVPNACPMEINRLSQLRARAFENMLAIATVNYPAGMPDCNGHSTAFDGIAFRDEGDMLLLDAGEAEGICVAHFPIDDLRAYRRREAFGDAYRHPRLYDLLLREQVEEPFLRKDARR